VVVSFVADEAWDAILGDKTAEAGMAAAVTVPSASSFILLENEE
jgi:hypothetical protein